MKFKNYLLVDKVLSVRRKDTSVRRMDREKMMTKNPWRCPMAYVVTMISVVGCGTPDSDEATELASLHTMVGPPSAAMSTDRGTGISPSTTDQQPGSAWTPSDDGSAPSPAPDNSPTPAQPSSDAMMPTTTNGEIEGSAWAPSDDDGEVDEAVTLDNLLTQIAANTCEVLTRCCDPTEVDSFFEPLTSNVHLEDLQGIFPPSTPFDASTCPDTLKQAYELAPFGPWIKAVREGYARLNVEAAQSCLDDMANLECGDAFNEHMFSGSCFGFTPPYTAITQRKPFTRTGQPGEACLRLTDGVGGGFFGTCDPAVSWCARVTEDGRTTIAPADEPGVCVRAGEAGDACGLAVVGQNGPSMVICQAGLECSSTDDSICTRPIQAKLTLGDRCYDTASFTTLGDCQESFCDLYGTYRCEPLKTIGTPCLAPYECETNDCQAGQCTEGGYCDGR
ncbi:MAG: hypothetical protein VX589_14445 [Myxococcota bacterium]|nr:hypothetical protein [Myxococcota bacterium]